MKYLLRIYSQRFRWMFFALLVSAFVVTGCGSNDDPVQFNNQVRFPSVQATTPTNGETNVPINTRVLATFSEPMQPDSFTNETFRVTGPGGTLVAGTIAYSGTTATFTPSNLLAPNTLYTAVVTGGARSVPGIGLPPNFVWTFTTGATQDTTSPTVTFTAPLNNATGVPVNTAVVATFNETMDPATITAASVKLTGPGNTPVAGTVTTVGNTAVFTPAANLAANTLFTGTVTTGAKDLAGNPLASNFVWTFTTGATPDTSAPSVTTTSPANNATGVLINSKLNVSFSEPMDPTSINATTFLLGAPGPTQVLGTITYIGTTATFTPLTNLAPNTLFTGVITTGARDLAGNPLASNFTFSFTTGATPDTTAPTVTSTAPVNAATGVPVNSKLNAVFSEAMDASSLTTSTFRATGPGATPISGTVTYVGTTATFSPTANLPANTVITATVTTGARDLAGNALASNFVWTFTTGATPDTSAPTVTVTTPENNATGVPVNSQLTAGFNEAMDPLTITTNTFTLRAPGNTPVAGTVTYVGTTATFTPTANLAGNTLFTATITTGAKDLAGNPLASNFVWTFTTGATPDTTAPTVTSTAPLNNASNVPVNSKINAVFSEAMDPLTINTTNFTATGPGGTPITGTVTYLGTTATFSPTANLPGNTLITATVKTGAKDLAGNALASNFVFTFTTGATPDTTAPAVVSTTPVNGAANVPVNSKLTATFSEAMDPLTITTDTFTLRAPGNVPVAGTVTYTGLTATFSPTATLAGNTLFTATITTGAKDLAGNALLANRVFTFTTGATPDTTAPTVSSSNPANGALNVAANTDPTITFNESMDPLTITTSTVTLTGPGNTPVAGTVTYNGTTATFNPTNPLALGTTFTGTVTTGAKDLAGNPLASNFVFSFTTAAEPKPGPVTLGAIAPFGSFGGGAGMTNQGLLTVVNGDIGTTGVPTSITGFTDSNANSYTVTGSNNGLVTGTVFTAPPAPGTQESFAIATAGAAAAQQAFDDLSPASLPGGTDPGAGQLGGLTLFPGIYQAAGGSFSITGSDLTLDAQGDPNAVFVFQAASSLNVGAPGFPRSVNLINGAQAKNVYWRVGSAATINPGGGGTFVGNVFASAGVVVSTAGSNIITTINGRLIGLNASVTLVNTVINVPAP